MDFFPSFFIPPPLHAENKIATRPSLSFLSPPCQKTFILIGGLGSLVQPLPSFRFGNVRFLCHRERSPSVLFWAPDDKLPTFPPPIPPPRRVQEDYSLRSLNQAIVPSPLFCGLPDSDLHFVVQYPSPFTFCLPLPLPADPRI